jgi:hypothetical protein
MPLHILDITPPSILKNQSLQQELNREGIIQFPFLPVSMLADLVRLYETMHPQVPVGPIKNFYVSTHSSDSSYKMKIESEVRRIIEPVCKVYFERYKLVTSAVIIKAPSPESELGIHQDWSAVDESQYASYGLWIPLVDITVQNGAMFVLKRSHRIGPTYRHTALPSVFAGIDQVADKYLVSFEAKAGDAILFNQSLLHKSSPNLSSYARPSIVSTIIPESAQHLMYAPSSVPGHLDAYLVENNYVQHFLSFFEDSLRVPEGAVKTNITVPVDFTPVQPQKFEQLYQTLISEN